MKCTVHDVRAGCSIRPTSPPQTHTHTHISSCQAYPVFILRRTAAKYPDKYRFLCRRIVSSLTAACFFPRKCCPSVNRLTKTKPTEYEILCPLTFPTLTSRQNWELWFECTSATRAAILTDLFPDYTLLECYSSWRCLRSPQRSDSRQRQ